MLPSGAGYKRPLSSASEVRGMDIHAWVVREDGPIDDYDNDTPQYRFARQMNGLTDERCYHALPPEEAKKVWKHLFKNAIEPNASLIRNEPARLWGAVERHGGMCHLRAYLAALKLQCDGVRYKIAVGSMGWRARDGRVWWEFG